jgi:zinc protease
LMKGTTSRSAEQIAREIESLGGSLDSYSASNSFGVTVEVMSGDFSAGLELMADVLLNPVFPDEALERERQVQLAAIRAQWDQLLQGAIKAMRRGLFGETGYGLDALGTEATLPALRTEDLRQFHRRLAAPANCVLAIYGDVDAEAVCQAVTQAFAGWKSQLALPTPVPPQPLKAVARLSEARDKKQGVLTVGFHGSTIYQEDRFALELLQEACSDLGSRLFLRIRDELGLAYYVGAQNVLGLTPGYFAFYAGTEPEKVALCEAEMLKEVALLRESGLTAEELVRTKAKVIGQKKIARQDLGQCATSAALDELYGLGFAYSDTEDARFEAVTTEDTRRVAQKYLTPDRMVVSVMGPW